MRAFKPVLVVDTTVDVGHDEVADALVSGGGESEFLDELALALDRQHAQSGHDGEKAFILEAARRVRELSKWFTEAQP